MINTIKIFELVILGFLFPLAVVYLKLSQSILLFLWIICIYAIIIMTLFYRREIKFDRLLKISYSKNKKYIKIILIRWILLSLVLFLFTKYFFPEKLFLIQKKDSDLLYKIFILYPFFSALPQEFIFCTFFFVRYEGFFKKDKNLVLTSAMIFCFAHIFSINWVAPLLSLFGGFIFAKTYKKTDSLILVSFEHALYGNTLFAIGLGWFFWGGSVS